MTKAKSESYEVTQEKVDTLKDLLASFWAYDLQRAWKSGFDAGRNSVGIVPIWEAPKKRAKAKPRRQEMVIGRGTKLCNKCYQIQANCRCWKRVKVHTQEGKQTV